jgi:hypothetical protein
MTMSTQLRLINGPTPGDRARTATPPDGAVTGSPVRAARPAAARRRTRPERLDAHTRAIGRAGVASARAALAAARPDPADADLRRAS